MAPARYLIRNTLLNAMDEPSFKNVRSLLKRVELLAGARLFETGEEAAHVLFIEEGIASSFLPMPDGRDVEILQTGPEGMVGRHAISATADTPYRTTMTTDGLVLMLPVKAFVDVVRQHQPLQHLLELYVYCCELQLAQFAISCLSHRLNVRLARWLLMCQDRLQSNALPFTHDFVASCLGTRRAGITNELHILEGMHAIKASRGLIEILDAEPIRNVAGNSYGLPENEYRRLISPLAIASREIQLA